MKLPKLVLNVIVISSLILIFCCSGSKQALITNKEAVKEVNYIPYYLKVYEADSLYIIGNYQRCFEILDSLSEKYELLNPIMTRDMELYAKTAYLTGNYKILKPTIKNLVSNWDYRSKYIEYDSLMYEVWKRAGITEKEASEWEKEFQNKINKGLRDTLILINKNDQLYRGKDRDKKIKREDSVDLVHIKLLKYIFQKYGYPDFRLVGYPKGGERVDLGVVFIHISNSVDENEYQFFQNQLLKYIKQGTTSPSCLADIVDKRSFDREHTTIYGTFGSNESWGDKMIKFDTAEINRNRKNIGLPSIQYQEFKWEQSSMYNQ